MPVFFGVVFKTDNVKSCLIHFPELQPVHYSQEFKKCMEVLPLIQPAYVVYACIKDLFIAGKGLQIASYLPVFFDHAYIVAFFGENGGAFKPAQAGADHQEIILAHCRGSVQMLRSMSPCLRLSPSASTETSLQNPSPFLSKCSAGHSGSC